MSYSLATLWHERQRFVPGILAVAFSAILIALQFGLLLGLFSVTSIPIDHTRADLWVGGPEVLSVDLARPVPESYLARVASMSEVERAEIYLQGFAYWAKPVGGSELCMIIGSRLGLEGDALGTVEELTPELRTLLQEPNSIIIDESELDRLGIKTVGDLAEVSGVCVKVVGLVKGLKSIAGPYVFCSLETGRRLLRLQPGQISYVLAKLRNPADAAAVTDQLREQYGDMSAFTSREFSLRSRLHWLTRTKAGIALGYSALLGLLVGGVVTSQTLFAATAACLREYAVLRALGIPRWRMMGAVLTQSFWVGLAGVTLALPTVLLLSRLADVLGARVLLPWELLTSATLVTMAVALISGVFALRSLRQVEPAMLLR